MKVTKWLPHNDILAQASVKLLVTDGDNSALYQCLYHALPALVLPTSAGDHAYNAYVIEQKGYGLQLDLLTFTPDEVSRSRVTLVQTHRQTTQTANE